MAPSLNRARVGCVVAALATALAAAPLAQGHHEPVTEHATASPRSMPMWTATGREVDRLGPKYVRLQHPITPPPPEPATAVKVIRPAGFDWADAGIGAAATALTLALVAALALLLTRRNRHAALPEGTELARG